jgi:predicted RNA methylase
MSNVRRDHALRLVRRQTSITPEIEAEEQTLEELQHERRRAAALRGHAKRRQRALSQWFTDPALAKRIIEWIMRGYPELAMGCTVLEPSAGAGALVRAMPPSWAVTACEIDGSLLPTLSGAHPQIQVLGGDFFSLYSADGPRRFDLAILNQPTEKQQWAKFMHRALDTCERVISLCPTASEHGLTNAIFWRRAQLDRKVILECRPGFGGDFRPQRDYIVVDTSPRRQKIDRPAIERWGDL